METLGTILTCLGFLSMPICLILLIIAAVRKKPKKKFSIALAMSFVTFIVGAIIGAFALPGDYENGMKAFENKQYKEAKNFLINVRSGDICYNDARRVLENLPSEAFSYYLQLSENCYNNDKKDIAILYLDSAFEWIPLADSHLVHFDFVSDLVLERAREAFRQSNYSKTLELLNHFSPLCKNYASAQSLLDSVLFIQAMDNYNKGIEAYQKKDYKMAERCLKMIPQKAKQYIQSQTLLKKIRFEAIDYYLNRARENLKADRISEARNFIDMASKWDTNNKQIKNLLQKIDAREQEIHLESQVKQIVSSVLKDFQILKTVVKTQNNKAEVTIAYYNESAASGDKFITDGCKRASEIFQKIFKEEKISSAQIILVSKFTDVYGNDFKGIAFEIELSAKEAKKINWDTFDPLNLLIISTITLPKVVTDELSYSLVEKINKNFFPIVLPGVSPWEGGK